MAQVRACYVDPRWLRGVAVSLLVLLPLAATAQSPAVPIQARQVFTSALKRVDEVDKRLKEKEQLHIFLAKFVDKSAPQALVLGLQTEIELLIDLTKTNDLIGKVIVVVNRLARGEPLNTTFAETAEKLQSLDDGLRSVQTTLSQHAAARQSFNVRLNQLTESLMAKDPSNTVSFIRVKTGLNTRSLDDDLTQQRLIIQSVVITIQTLK